MPDLAGVHHLAAIHAFEKVGFHVRRHGKHVVMTDGTRHNPVNAVTMGTIVRDAGLTIEEFRKLLSPESMASQLVRWLVVAGLRFQLSRSATADRAYLCGAGIGLTGGCSGPRPPRSVCGKMAVFVVKWQSMIGGRGR